MFVASEKLFVGWHNYHSQVGLPARLSEFGASCRDAGKAECLYYLELFNDSWVPKTNGAQVGCVAVLEKVLGRLHLGDTAGNPVLHRTLKPLAGSWQPQVWDLQNVNPLDLVCPTPMPDSVVFKYCDSIPKHLMPEYITVCAIMHMFYALYALTHFKS